MADGGAGTDLADDLYAVLGVAPGASDAEVARAYRRLARETHPDANPSDPDADARFRRVATAYEVLGDPRRRAAYDAGRAARAAALAGFSGDWLGDLLGGGPSTDVEASVAVSFADALTGTDVTASVPAQFTCTGCAGSGARPGTAPEACAGCGGAGVRTLAGPFTLSLACPDCGGRGWVVADPCEECAGAGTLWRHRDVSVRVPPGVVDGDVVRVPGLGAGPRRRPGDLHLRVTVAPDARFARAGADVTVTVPVSFPEAALGATVPVPTPTGEPVRIRVPAGTPSGRVLRVRGRGVPGAGDLLVTVVVDVPTNLSAEAATSVAALAGLLPAARPDTP